MPVDKSRYPDNWNEITARIRLRANNRCEQCGVPNHAYIVRSSEDAERYLILREDGCQYTQDGQIIRMSETPSEFAGDMIRVVLTVAHYPDPNPMNCADDNLHCLCQLHHNRLDSPMRVVNARKTRLNKKREAVKATGQKEMFE